MVGKTRGRRGYRCQGNCIKILKEHNHSILAMQFAKRREENALGSYSTHALAKCDPPTAAVIVNAGEYLQNIARVWGEATPAERREIVRAVLDDVICDPETRLFIALKPKPVFRLLFRQIRGLVERDGGFEIK